MFGLIGKLIGAAALGAAGYYGYKRFFGSTDAMACDVEQPWYMPEPGYSCGMKTSSGEITGMQYQKGEWVYQFNSGHLARESEMKLQNKAALSGAAVRIL